MIRWFKLIKDRIYSTSSRKLISHPLNEYVKPNKSSEPAGAKGGVDG
jgi:hypothetical protein